MKTSAADRWRRSLEAWALPDELLEAVPDSPYGWSTELWKRRARLAREQGGDNPTAVAVRSLLPTGGSLLDVGAGTGRASLQHAVEGHPVSAVEKNPEMAIGLQGRAAELGVTVDLVEGSWPEVAGAVAVYDVVVCAHVVFDVQDVEPFVSALHRHAGRGVVVELTPDHPWSGLTPYYRALHDLKRPDGPTYHDFVSVVEHACGVQPRVEVWTRPGQVWFESWDEILAHYGKRLVLPKHRWEELRGVLAPDTTEDDGRLFVGSRDRTIVTVWWRIKR